MPEFIEGEADFEKSHRQADDALTRLDEIVGPDYVTRLETIVELTAKVKCLARMDSGEDCGVCPPCQARRLMVELRPASTVRDGIVECEKCVDRELAEAAYKRSLRAREG